MLYDETNNYHNIETQLVYFLLSVDISTEIGQFCHEQNPDRVDLHVCL